MGPVLQTCGFTAFLQARFLLHESSLSSGMKTGSALTSAFPLGS